MTGLVASTSEIAKALGVSGQAVRKRAARQKWRSEEQRAPGGGHIYKIDTLPIGGDDKQRIQIALLLAAAPKISGPQAAADQQQPQAAQAPRSPREGAQASRKTYDREALWDYYGKKTNKIKAIADRRFGLVLAVETLARSGISVTEARRRVAENEKESYRSMIRYCRAVEGYDRGDWLPALVPGFAGRLKMAEMSQEAWDYFKADYLRMDRNGPPTAAACYERLTRAAKEHGWAVPSLRTFMRRINREIPANLVILLRRGEDAYKASYPAQERDRTVFHACQAVNGDGHQSSKYVMFESGEVCQPKTWYWQDIHSSKILAWRADVSENKDMIRLATLDLIGKYGVPEDFYLDNTRAAANKDMTGGVKNRYRFKIKEDEPMGLIPRMGANVHWSTPGHGQAKPVERAFGSGGLGEYIDKHPSFAGRGTMKNPIPIAEFEQVQAAEVAACNARRGRRGKIQAGRSYDEVFAESYTRHPIRKATARQRAAWLLAPAPVRCNGRDGSITIMENRYYCDELAEHKGLKVVARFDPANLHAGILVETLDGREIGRAECVQAAGFNDRDAARDHARERARIRKNLRKVQKSELRLSAIEAAKMLPDMPQDEEELEARILKPVFEPARRVVNSGLVDDGDGDDPYNFNATVLAALEHQRRNRL